MNSSFYKPFTFDRVIRLIIGTVITIFIVLALKYLSRVLLPFFIAWLLAYLIYPMVKFVQSKLHIKSKNLSVITVLSTILILIIGALWILIPAVVSEMLKLKDIILRYAENDPSGLIPHSWENILQYFITNTDIEHFLNKKNILETARELFPRAWEILSNSLNMAISFFLTFIILLYLFFILRDYHKIAKGFISLIPEKMRGFVSELMRDMEEGMSRYYRGQALVAMIIGILFSIGFSVIGLPLGILMGIFIGILNLIPYMQVLGIPPTILLMLLRIAENGESPWWPLFLLFLVYTIVQIIQDTYLVPKIMGKAMGLNPAVILLSLSIWGTLLGVLGMIIALPATTLLISYYRRFILDERIKQSKKTDEIKIKE